MDAKARTGQALSRFLNVVDGLIGQGLRLLVLVTSNEDLGKLHPAVNRPGRCIQKILFQPFTSVEAHKHGQGLLYIGGELSRLAKARAVP
jgi:hypothetical protein